MLTFGMVTQENFPAFVPFNTTIPGLYLHHRPLIIISPIAQPLELQRSQGNLLV